MPSLDSHWRTMRSCMGSAAKSLTIELQEIAVRGRPELDGAFTSLADKGIDALVLNEDPVLVGIAPAIVDMVARQRIPSIGFLEFGEAGGLMAYGASIVEMHRHAAVF